MHWGAFAGIYFDKNVTSAVAWRLLFMCILPGKIIKYAFGCMPHNTECFLQQLTCLGSNST